MLCFPLLMLLFRATVQKGPPEGAGPLSSCSSQAGCLEFDIRDEETLDSNGDKQYSLCLWWDEANALCYKEGSISHACPVQGSHLDEFKVENWASGEDNKLPCITVGCGQTATFGVKDGARCDDASAFDPISNDYDITCSAGGSCGGKNAKACQWTVKAPDCDESPTVSTSTSTTTSAPDRDECIITPCAEDTTISKCTSNLCSCQWQVADDDPIEDGTCVPGSVNANAFARSQVFHTNDELKGITGDNEGGLGYVVIPLEALIFAGASIMAIFVIMACVCGIVKRRKARRGVAVVEQEEEVFGTGTSP